jgi:hypothetical protein
MEKNLKIELENKLSCKFLNNLYVGLLHQL